MSTDFAKTFRMAINQKHRGSKMDDESYNARAQDWNLLKIFHVIAQHNGLTRAAEVLSRKQPAISLALRRLEDRLGVKLCHRGPGGFTLTDEGIIVADTCTKLWGEIGGLNKKIANISADIRGRLNVQVISNLVDSGLDSAIETFHSAHPLVEIYVAVVTWEVVGRSVLRNESDIGIGPAHQKNPRLQYDPIFLEFHRPYCGPQHPLWGESFEDPRSLANEAFVLTGADEPDELTQFRNRYGLGGIVAGMSEHL